MEEGGRTQIPEEGTEYTVRARNVIHVVSFRFNCNNPIKRVFFIPILMRKKLRPGEINYPCIQSGIQTQI